MSWIAKAYSFQRHVRDTFVKKLAQAMKIVTKLYNGADRFSFLHSQKDMDKSWQLDTSPLQNVYIPLDNLLDHSQPLAEVGGIRGSLQLLAVHPAIASGANAGASNHLSHAGAPD